MRLTSVPASAARMLAYDDQRRGTGPTPGPKGKGEFEDRSHHTNISRRRQREAYANEQFFGVAYNAEGTSYIKDAGDSFDDVD